MPGPPKYDQVKHDLRIPYGSSSYMQHNYIDHGYAVVKAYMGIISVTTETQ